MTTSLTRITVNLTPRAWGALASLMEAAGDNNKTRAVETALVRQAWVQKQMEDAGATEVIIRNKDAGTDTVVAFI
jgi:hypothetical protein